MLDTVMFGPNTMLQRTIMKIKC